MSLSSASLVCLIAYLILCDFQVDELSLVEVARRTNATTLLHKHETTKLESYQFKTFLTTTTAQKYISRDSRFLFLPQTFQPTTHNQSRGPRKGGRGGPWPLWILTFICLIKKAVFLVWNGKHEIPPLFWPPLEKSFWLHLNNPPTQSTIDPLEKIFSTPMDTAWYFFPTNCVTKHVTEIEARDSDPMQTSQRTKAANTRDNNAAVIQTSPTLPCLRTHTGNSPHWTKGKSSICRRPA